MPNAVKLFDELKEKVLAEHAGIHHPLMKEIFAGELTPEQLAGFAREFWVIPHTHLINNAGKLAHAQMLRGPLLQQILGSPYDSEIRDILADSLGDELGHTDISPVNHYDCYFDFTDALGIPRSEMGDIRKLSSQALITMYVWTTTALNFSLLELLSSHNFVNDTVNVIGYAKLAKALREHYHLDDKAVLWFSLHGEVDVEHGSRSRAILERLVRTDEDEEVVRHAVQFGLGVKWTLFDGVMNRYVSNYLPAMAT